MAARAGQRRAGVTEEIKKVQRASARRKARAPDPRDAGERRKLEIPEAFSFLPPLGPPLGAAAHRYAFGGRGSAKSHSFATALVLMGRTKRLRILCLREIQDSIDDSVKTLLEDKIKALGLSWFYRSTKTAIIGLNGTRFSFKGMWSRPDSLKGAEGVDIVWVEEASSVSKVSIQKLIPTIRKPGSEIWWTWNPENEDDPVDVLFRGPPGDKRDDGSHAPPRSIGGAVNWDQNPFFDGPPQSEGAKLREQMEDARRRDPDLYFHVWLGGYKRNSEARVFRNWKEEEFETPANVERFYFGGDWGFANDPSVLVRCFIVGRTLYIDREVHKVGVQIDDLPAFFAGDDTRKPPRWENGQLGEERVRYLGIEGATKWPICADSSRPDTIAYMVRRGFNIMPAKKGPGSIEDGVEFLKSFDIVVHSKHCPHTINELIRYSFKVDKKTQEVLPVLADKDNHVIDALRYALETLRLATAGQSLWELERQAAAERDKIAAEAAKVQPVVIHQPGSVEHTQHEAQLRAEKAAADMAALMAANS